MIVRHSFTLNGIQYDIVREGVELWVEGYGPPDEAFHRYPCHLRNHTWLEVTGLVCVPL